MLTRVGTFVEGKVLWLLETFFPALVAPRLAIDNGSWHGSMQMSTLFAACVVYNMIVVATPGTNTTVMCKKDGLNLW